MRGGDVMPTGYTADLYEGKPLTFPEFAMQCARAFGALILMRDDPADAAIPDEFPPSDYHLRKLESAVARLDELGQLTEAEAERVARIEHEGALVAFRKSMRERRERRQRYEAMLAEVYAWTPPTSDHVEMKKFMTDQLEKSIDFDCGYRLDPPTPLSGSEWLHRQVDGAWQNIAYHTDEWLQECERAERRTAWVRSLRESLSGLAVSS